MIYFIIGFIIVAIVFWAGAVAIKEDREEHKFHEWKIKYD